MEKAKELKSKLTPGQALKQKLLKKGVSKHKKDMAKMGAFFSSVLNGVDLKELRKRAWKTE